MRRRFPRTGTSRLEPRCLQLLEAERAGWWKAQNFQQWKNLYVSEYARGFLVLDTLRRYVPAFEAGGARNLDIGSGDAGVPIAFAECGARIAEPGEVRPGKQRLARWTSRQEWIFTNPVIRLLLDVGMGSNFFIARKTA